MNCTIFSVLRAGSLICRRLGNRNYLSEAYKCEEAWRQRLEQPLIKTINPGVYFYELERKHRAEGKVSAIDVDLFVNSIDGKNVTKYIKELEWIIRHLRRSPETINTLPSMTHSIIRILLENDHVDMLNKMLSTPLLYGVFPDYYTANLLMDTFLNQNNMTDAARVASILMLQEDFGPPLTQALALSSCYRYAMNECNNPWIDYSPKIEEPEETVRVRVSYLRNPYFDDHFDLKDSNHIVGKTLAWLSPLIQGVIGENCEVLGWALFEKWDNLLKCVKQVAEQDHRISSPIVSKVELCLEKCQDESKREAILSSMQVLKSDFDLDEIISNFINRTVTSEESSAIDAQIKTFNEWELMRVEVVNKQLKEYEKQRLLQLIKEKKEHLTAEEELIYFFDNEDKLQILMEEKLKIDAEIEARKPTKSKKEEDKEYIPPEVHRRF